MKDVYVHARVVRGRVEVSGTPSATLGHPLDHCSEHGREGVFVQWHWDGTRLTVRNDRYGFHPCFYFQSENEICVSPSIVRLLKEGAPTDFDYPGFAVFLHLGCFVGEDTPFKQIRALPPRARLEWEKGRFNLSGGFTIPKPRAIARDEAMAVYADLFKAAMRRRLPPSPNFAVPLSAGKDSRHILLALCAMGHRPRFCITMKRFPPSGDQDSEIAARLTRTLHLHHVILDQPRSLFRVELRKNVLTHFCSHQHQWTLAMADFLAGRVEAAYDGLAGDVLSTGHGLTPERLALSESGRFVDVSLDLVGRRGRTNVTAEAALARLLGPRESRRLSRDVAIARLTSEVVRHADAPNPMGSFYFWNIDRRDIALAPYALLATIPRVFCPYLDHALYDFLSALPARLLLDREFHAETIRRGYPHHAHIPFQDKSAPPRSTWQQDARFAREMAAYVLRRKPSRWIRNRYLLPRMLGSLLSSRYAASTRWFGPLAAYLLHFESVMNGAGWPTADPGSEPRVCN